MNIRTLCICMWLLFRLIPGNPESVCAEELRTKIPVKVKADKLEYDRAKDVYIAEGHVKIEQDGIRAEAEKIILNNKTGEATAEGNVFFQEKGDIIRADNMRVNFSTKAGIIYNGELFMSKDNLHLKGELIERRSETVYHVEKGTFTTCDEGDWYLKADEIDVDMNKYAVGRGVSFNMIGLPVFYTPYLLFPVRRQTGLLIPEAGYSSREGFIMKNAFFWAISDYMDMTLYSDYRARHGIGTGIEYRYEISRDSDGRIFYNYFDTYKQYRERRISDLVASGQPLPDLPEKLWLFSYQHHEEIAEDLSVRADINIASHFSYFRELYESIEARSRPYLDSNLFYIERWDTSSLHFLGQYTIDLTQPNNENTTQKLPELRFNIFEEKIAGPLRFNFEGTATNYAVEPGDNVMRADFNSRISAVFGGSGLAFTPRAGFRGTFYDSSNLSSEPSERTYYYVEADLNSRFSRIYGTDGDAGFGRVRHSIEPAISYLYVPYRNQSDLPLVDAGPVDEENLVTVSLINRLTAKYKEASAIKTFDAVIVRLSESFDLEKTRSDDSSLLRSEIRGELFVKTPKVLTVSATENFNTYTHRWTTSSENITANTGTVRFNVSRQAVLEPKSRYIIAGAGMRLGKWDLDGQAWRDAVQKKTTQQEYRLHYASQCWGLGATYITKPGETHFMLTLDLKGLGTF